MLYAPKQKRDENNKNNKLSNFNEVFGVFLISTEHINTVP
jgi:hypothetical protein